MRTLRVAGLSLFAVFCHCAEARPGFYCHSFSKKYEITIALGGSATDQPTAQVVVDHASPALGSLRCEKQASGRMLACTSSSGSSHQGYEARFSDFSGAWDGVVWSRHPQGKEKLANLSCWSST
jgi:hypothetical protein